MLAFALGWVTKIDQEDLPHTRRTALFDCLPIGKAGSVKLNPAHGSYQCLHFILRSRQ